MDAKVILKINDAKKILLKRYLNKNGKAQIKFTQEVAKQCNNYIPYRTGRLKDMMIKLQANKIIYNAPYARKQYYSNSGNGKQGSSLGGLRGKLWDRRMFADRGDKIVQAIAEFVGGRSK
ncbi:minor capsid protein [Clostridium septicum]|uniref:Capsid protein n=1 Tax=Clostridium septicum TaxID=1504 RepID=A0A9N7PM16_CLOSE|nr:minor capsid protein [Clostridium septicum]AYE35311.1 capsid protein [Clostridium septicum]UEC20033.1 minor capsid protein [Clostridium septicum]USS01911.1 minor capsid protein [Clostridium septicum]